MQALREQEEQVVGVLLQRLAAAEAAVEVAGSADPVLRRRVEMLMGGTGTEVVGAGAARVGEDQVRRRLGEIKEEERREEGGREEGKEGGEE